MRRVITHTHSDGVILHRTSSDRVTVATDVTLGGATALYGVRSMSADWSLTNFGTLVGQNSGIVMEVGGRIANGAGGHSTALISGSAYGVLVRGGQGLVTNEGTITAAHGYTLVGPS